MGVTEKKNYGVHPFYPDYIGDTLCRNAGIVFTKMCDFMCQKMVFFILKCSRIQKLKIFYFTYYCMSLFFKHTWRILYIYFFRIINTVIFIVSPCIFIYLLVFTNSSPLDTARYTRAIQICCYITNHKCIQWLILLILTIKFYNFKVLLAT